MTVRVSVTAGLIPSAIVDHLILNIESPLDYIMNVPGHHQVKNYILLRMKNLISTL